MIIRLVKLTFRTEQVDAFRELFGTHKGQIRGAAGCSHLALWQDDTVPGLFFTLSHWNEASDLEAYRESALFRGIWRMVKPWFAAPAEAWTLSEREMA